MSNNSAEDGIRLSHLTDSQRSTLEMFQEIANINDDYLCMQILQQNQWNLDLSLNQFVQGQQPSLSPSLNDNVNIETDSDITRQYNNNGVAPTRMSNSSSNSTTNQRSSSTSTVSSRNNNNNTGGLFGLLLVPLRWIFQVRPTSLNPEQDALKFIDDYNRKYSPNHALFHPNSYQHAVSSSYQRSKFLLVYLHSPLHDDTDRFCETIMTAPTIISHLNQHMVTWVGQVWDAEAYALSSQLKVSSYPFLAVLVCQSNRSAQVADHIQGYMEEGPLLERLQRSCNTFNAVLTRNQQETQRRDEASRLRAQQDREYLESQEQDRIEQERQKELLHKQQQEELEKQQAEELSAAIEMSRQLSFEDRIRKIKTEFESSPEPSSTDTINVATIRFQLPAGKKISRRFYKNDKIQIIFNYLKLHFATNYESNHSITSPNKTTTSVETSNHQDMIGADNNNHIIKNFSVCTHFPKIELTDMNQTIESIGLYPRGMLYVQDLDV